jgi:hypothetical protein
MLRAGRTGANSNRAISPTMKAYIYSSQDSQGAFSTHSLRCDAVGPDVSSHCEMSRNIRFTSASFSSFVPSSPAILSISKLR